MYFGECLHSNNGRQNLYSCLKQIQISKEYILLRDISQLINLVLKENILQKSYFNQDQTLDIQVGPA